MLDRALDWTGDHPVITVVICLLLLTGGCGISIHVGILSSQTKLMPY
jgi:hypothetical protein